MEKTSRVIIFILLGALAALATTACQRSKETSVAAAGQTAPEDAPSQADKAFVLDAEETSVKEIALGKLVLQKSQNDDVKTYAKMMVDDHSHVLDDLTALMKKLSISQPTTLDEAREEALGMIKDLIGPAFDRGFMNMMAAGHRAAVTKCRNETNLGQNKDVRKYATDYLPTLEQHLERAEDLQGKLPVAPRVR